MMDFYIISDDKPKPNSVGMLEFAGSINETIFKELKKEGIVEERFDFYTDFRLTNQTVKAKLDFINFNNLKRNQSVLEYSLILETAIFKTSGLLACCD